MVSRRTFIELSATSVAGTAIPAAVQSFAAALSADSRDIERALFDERFEEARTFGAALAARGVPVRGVRGDVAMLWYGDLKTRLIEQRLPLVGLTDRTALFCLEELARDLGMKVRGRIDHAVDRGGNVSHRAAGSTAWLDAGRRLGGAPGFGRAVATLVADPALHGSALMAQKRSGPFSAFGGTTLVSWWIG